MDDVLGEIFPEDDVSDLEEELEVVRNGYSYMTPSRWRNMSEEERRAYCFD